jgi:serine protease AprX
MRFFAKAYAMHESEVLALREEADAGALTADSIHDGVVDCEIDEEAIGRLAERGILVQAIAPVSAPQGGGAKMAGATPGSGSDVRRRGLAHGPGTQRRPEYILIDLLAALSDRVIEALRQAGAEIVERDPSGSLVVNAKRGMAPVEALEFVTGVRSYGVRETLGDAPDPEAGEPVPSQSGPIRRSGTGPRFARVPGARASRGDVAGAGRYDALLHADASMARVTQEFGALGAKVIKAANRTISFTLGRASLARIAELNGVASVSKAGMPRLFDDRARALVGLAAAAPAVSLPYDGNGEIVGVADTGLDERHEDFDGRIVGVVALGRTNDASDPDGHGTHVAGTVLGSGKLSNGVLRGVAPSASLYFQSVMDVNGELGGLPDPLTPLFQQAYDAGVRVHNNSWGAYVQARYEAMALEMDEFVHAHPDFLPVVAAGNDGTCRNAVNTPGGFVDFPSVGSPATAKNALTVGASRSDRTSGGLSAMTWSDAWPEDFFDPPIAAETVSGDDQGLAAFSSRGPCDDMRIKPDLVAPGTDIASARSADAPPHRFWGAYPNNPNYAFMGGTSMACPVVAGCAALVRQYFREREGLDRPSAALVKATLLNGTRRLDGADAAADPKGAPNYHQGFGRLDMERSIPAPDDPNIDLFFVDTFSTHPHARFVSRSARQRWKFEVVAHGWIRVALVWTDWPGRALENQLRVVMDGLRHGSIVNWVGNDGAVAPLRFPAHDPRALLPDHANVITRDPLNNVQVIRTELEPGTFTLAVFADSLLRLPQDFAVAVTAPRGVISAFRGA